MPSREDHPLTLASHKMPKFYTGVYIQSVVIIFVFEVRLEDYSGLCLVVLSEPLRVVWKFRGRTSTRVITSDELNDPVLINTISDPGFTTVRLFCRASNHTRRNN